MSTKFWTEQLKDESTPKAPRILMCCPTWEGGEYALKRWAKAFHDQTWPNKVAFMADNSMTENLHYTHKVRAEGIHARWMPKRMSYFWDTIELAWTEFILPFAHEQGCDYVFSVEHDVIVPPDAMQKMYDAAWEHAENGKPAVVAQRYHPRGQEGVDFWWDTLGCSLFPLEPLWNDRLLCKASYEIEVFIVSQRYGHPRYRAVDVIEVEHLKDPDDRKGEEFQSSPAYDQYIQRKINYAAAQGQDVSAFTQTMPLAQPSLDVEPAITVAAPPVEEPPAEPEAAKTLTPSGPINFYVPKGAPVELSEGEETPPLNLQDLTPRATVKSSGVGIQLPPEEVPVNLAGLSQNELIKELVMNQSRLRLNVGCGYQQISGFKGVDIDPRVTPDILAPADDLPIEDNTVDMIYASHIFEHLPYESKALEEWMRVLKPGGYLDIIVPDVIQTYYLYRHNGKWGDYSLPIDELYVQAVAFGAHLLADAIPEMRDTYGGPGHEHKQIFFFDMLKDRVLKAGYVEVHESAACFLRHIAIGETLVQARKPW